MEESLFVVFGDLTEGGVKWLESVYGLANAQRRMKRIAAEKPGSYFVFDLQTASIVAKTNTVKQLKWVSPPPQAGAA
jgi:hypothetical protein